MTSSTIAFPRTSSVLSRSSRISLHALRTSALDVHGLFYGTLEDVNNPSNLDPTSYALHHHHHPDSLSRSIEKLYDPNAVYENPWLLAGDRDTIVDIHALLTKITALGSHTRPFSFILGEQDFMRPIQVWSEVGEICEAENFDGNRTSIIEHTIHVLLLPGIHTPVFCCQSGSQDNSPSGSAGNPAKPSLRLRVPFVGALVPGWSPLHLKMKVLTRLSFNESGLVTSHRDLVDVIDMLTVIPGFTALQWFGSSLVGRILGSVSSILFRGTESVTEDSSTDEEVLYTARRGSIRRKNSRLAMNDRPAPRAPDVDRD